MLIIWRNRHGARGVIARRCGRGKRQETRRRGAGQGKANNNRRVCSPIVLSIAADEKHAQLNLSQVAGACGVIATFTVGPRESSSGLPAHTELKLSHCVFRPAPMGCSFPKCCVAIYIKAVYGCEGKRVTRLQGLRRATSLEELESQSVRHTRYSTSSPSMDFLMCSSTVVIQASSF
jgi:hypothetical protein